jgi:hypothetical protein
MPEGHKIEIVALDMLSYATGIAIEFHLHRGLSSSAAKQLIVHCRNGRSRSPAVILIFFLVFRSYELEVAIKILHKIILVFE